MKKLWLAIYCLLTPLLAQAATRVALVSTCGGKAGEDLLTLAEVKLSAEPGIEVLERRDVERVLSEQKLMRCGLSEAVSAVTVGRVLGVDVFASLETVAGEKEALGLVIYDARTGVKLWDSVLPGDGIERTANAVMTAVMLGLDKSSRQQAGAVTTLCVGAVRNATLPRAFDSLCQSVGVLLERRLLDVSGLAVVERRHLEHVNQERTLPVDAAWTDLLGSLVTVELEMTRGESTNGMHATVLLKDGKGADIGKVSADSTKSNTADLADELTRRIAERLKTQPPQATADRSKEAERFSREAMYLGNEHNILAALQAAEAAAALAPTNEAIHGQLCQCLVQYAKEVLNGGRAELDRGLDVGLRALEMATAIRRRAIAKGRPMDVSPESGLGDYDGFWDRVFRFSAGADAETMQKMRTFQEGYRHLIVNIVGKESLVLVKKNGTIAEYKWWLYESVHNLSFFESTSAEWTADIIELFHDWLKTLEDQPLQEGWWEQGNRMMARVCYQTKSGVRSSGLPHLQPADVEQLNGLFSQMTTHLDPLVQCYGHIGQFATQLHSQPQPSPELLDRYSSGFPVVSSTVSQPQPAPEMLERYQATMQFIRQKIVTSGREPKREYTRFAYGAALDLIDLWPDPKMRTREYLNLFNFMLERKDIEYWVSREVTDPTVFTFRHYRTMTGGDWYPDVFPREVTPVNPQDYDELLARGERVLTLLHSGAGHDVDTVLFSCNHGGLFEAEMAFIQQEIFKQRPDLAPKIAPPWTKAGLLWESAGSNACSIAGVRVVGNAVYAATQGDRIQTVRIPLDGGPPTFLGKAGPAAAKITCTTFYNGHYFVGTASDGILIFPAAAGEVVVIGEMNGLPDGHVQSLACVDGKLYAGLAGGYLVVYDLQAKQCAVIASSRRREKQTPLDDRSPPFEITGMLSDPSRHRVLLLVGAPYPTIRDDPVLGLWQIDTATGKLTQLFATAFNPNWIHWNRDHQVLIAYLFSTSGDSFASNKATPYGLIGFDPASNDAQLLYAYDGRPAGPKMPNKTAGHLPMNPSPPYLLWDGWLWYDKDDRTYRISPGGTVPEPCPSPRKTESVSLSNWQRLEIVENSNQIVAADAHSIWVLTLPGKSAKESP